MKIKKKCLEIIKHTIITCKENKRKITFLNPNKKSISKILVDGCQIIDGLRCDYLITYDTRQEFVELKGKNLEHAFKQLERTIDLLGKKNHQKRAFVISSRSPLTSPVIQSQKLRFKRKFKSELIVKNNSESVKIT